MLTCSKLEETGAGLPGQSGDLQRVLRKPEIEPSTQTGGRALHGREGAPPSQGLITHCFIN